MQPCYAGVLPYPEEPQAGDEYFPPLEDEYFPAPKDEYFPAPKDEYFPAPKRHHSAPPEQNHLPAPEQSHSPAPEQDHSFAPAPEQSYSFAPGQYYSPAPEQYYSAPPQLEPQADPRVAELDTATVVFPQPDFGPSTDLSAEEPGGDWVEEPDDTWAETPDDAPVDHADGTWVEDSADTWVEAPEDASVEVTGGAPAEELDDATIVFPRIEDGTEGDPTVEDPDDDATVVFSLADYEPAPAPAEAALAGDAGTGSRSIGKKAAVGAVVAGGLVAGQIGWSAAFADEGNSADHPSMLAASVTNSSILPVPNEPDAGMINQRDIENLHKGDDLAMQAAYAHAASAHAVRGNTAPTQAARQREAMVLGGGGNLDDWISVALQKLRLDEAWAPSVKRIILEESRGNPAAINRWDSNALAGRPSQGLMQVIPTTYLRYVLPELAGRPITDPVANITAGIRYMLSNYGYLTLSRGGRYNAFGQYVGY
jgi:soluble lytic murein transglycosylase-like protein